MALWHSRSAGPADCAGILALRQAVFGAADPVRATPAGWHWQFGANPAGPGVIQVAEHAGRIVGQYAVIPTMLRIAGDVRRTAMSCDTMVHPDYQRQGMFVTLARAVYAQLRHSGIETIWGWPNAASAPTFRGKLGWQDIGTPTLLARPVQGTSLLARWLRPPWTRWLGRVADTLTRPRVLPATLREVPAERLVCDAAMTQPRTAAWLGWRYGLPAFDYRCYQIRPGTILVLRVLELFGTRVAIIMDLLPWADREGLRAAWHLAHAAGAALLLCLTTAPRPAMHAGFVPIPARWAPRPFLLSARLGGNETPLRMCAAWAVSFGDTDLVQSVVALLREKHDCRHDRAKEGLEIDDLARRLRELRLL